MHRQCCVCKRFACTDDGWLKFIFTCGEFPCGTYWWSKFIYDCGGIKVTHGYCPVCLAAWNEAIFLKFLSEWFRNY